MGVTAQTQARLHVPFNTYVTKVVSRCNLNCSYCYMYNLQDKTWRGQPAVMTTEVARAMGQRIREHCSLHEQRWVHIILHGGEPLLMPIPHFKTLLAIWREEILSVAEVSFSVQSNGTLIDDDWIEALAEERVRIGISIDGPRNFHDRFRVDHKGHGSFDDVVTAILKLRSHPHGPNVFSNVMAVVNPEVPPSELMDFWKTLDVEGFDISLPHANYAHPPPRTAAAQTYGDWMIEFFDLWFEWNRPDRSIRFFENIIRMLFGYPLSTDNIGGKPVGVIVVETDGGIEPTDAFKSCDNGITKLGLNVLTHSFDDLYSIDMVSVLQSGSIALCVECQDCDARDVCGGGYMPHRFSLQNGFDNPSIYCDDLYKLVHHISCRVQESIEPELLCLLQRGNP